MNPIPCCAFLLVGFVALGAAHDAACAVEPEERGVRRMDQGLVLRPGTGRTRTTCAADPALRVEGDRLLGAEDKVLAKLVRGSAESVGSHSFSADGGLLVVGIRYDSVRGGRDGTIRGYVRLYEARTGKLLWDSGAPLIGPIVHVGFSEKGDAVLYQEGKIVFVGGK